MSNITKYYLYRGATSALFFLPIMTIFYQANNLTFTQIFILQSWYTFASIALDIPTSGLADLLQRKLSLLISTVLYLVGFLTYYFATSFFMFLVAETFLGFGVAMLSGVGAAFVYDSLLEEGRQGQDKIVFSRAASISLGTMAVASIVGSIVANRYGLRLPLLLTALAFSIAAIIVINFREPKKTKLNRALTFKQYWSQLREGFEIALRNRTTLFLVLDLAIIGSMLRIAYFYIQPLMRDTGLPIEYFGAVFAAMSVLAAVIVHLGPLLDRVYGSINTILSLRLLSLAFIALLTIPLFLIPTIAALGISAIMNIRGALYSAYLNRVIPSSHRATVLSYSAVIGSLAYLIMGPLVGQLSDVLGSRAALLAVAFILTPLALVRGGLERLREPS